MFIILSLVAVLIAPITPFSYPVFGTKRYHRAIPSKTVTPIFNTPYYDEPIPAQAAYPRYQGDSNYYYLPRRESQYYGLPTYRGEYKPTQYYYAHSPSYSYYDDRSEQANPLDDLHEEMLQEDQRERLRDYSIGQETWYENPAAKQDKLTNVFLKNLIAYNKQMNQEPEFKSQNGEFDDYNDGNDAEYYDQGSNNNNLNIRKYNNHQQHHSDYKENEDKDVMDLNSLADKHHNNMEQLSQSNYPDYQQDLSNPYEEDPEYDDDTWINWSSKRSGNNADSTIGIGLATFSDRKPSTEQHLHKPIVSVPTTKKTKPKPLAEFPSSQPTDHSKGVKLFGSGQKEIVLPRPATPVRTPFSSPVMEMLTHNAVQDKRQAKSKSNVYDTIKQLLAMEHDLDKSATETKIQKRFVSNEESLVHELNGLRGADKV